MTNCGPLYYADAFVGVLGKIWEEKGKEQLVTYSVVCMKTAGGGARLCCGEDVPPFKSRLMQISTLIAKRQGTTLVVYWHFRPSVFGRSTGKLQTKTASRFATLFFMY